MGQQPPETLFRTVKELAELFRVSQKTAQRWKTGTICPPESVLMVLRGDLGIYHRDWRGWVLKNGFLYSPEGWEIRMSDVLASRLHEAQLAVYRAENRRLKDELEHALCPIKEDQPTTQDWDIQILTG